MGIVVQYKQAEDLHGFIEDFRLGWERHVIHRCVHGVTHPEGVLPQNVNATSLRFSLEGSGAQNIVIAHNIPHMKSL